MKIITSTNWFTLSEIEVLSLQDSLQNGYKTQLLIISKADAEAFTEQIEQAYQTKITH